MFLTFFFFILDFKRIVLEELSLINIKLNHIMKTATAVATKQSEGDSDKTVTKNIEIFYENIPIKTVEQLEEIERWLDNKENCMAVVSECI